MTIANNQLENQIFHLEMEIGTLRARAQLMGLEDRERTHKILGERLRSYRLLTGHDYDDGHYRPEKED